MRQNEEPLISVLMGVLYRRESVNLLERSIHSIQDQTYSNWELLICDDGSTDVACRYLDKIAAQDERIRLIRGCKKTDLASKLNRCLSEAKGSYIARMDDDDYSYPKRLARQIIYLEDHPEIAFVGCCADLWRKDAVIGKRVVPEYPRVRDFYMTQPYLHPAMVFRREALEAAEGYSEDKRCVLCEDYDLFLRLYAKGCHGANLQETLLIYTLPDTVKGTRRMRHRWNEAVTRYECFKDLGLLPGALPYVVKPLAVGLLPERVLAQIKKRWSTGG